MNKQNTHECALMESIDPKQEFEKAIFKKYSQQSKKISVVKTSKV